MVTDGNQTYCGDHFTVYTNVTSLCCIPQTNIMLYYTATKKGKKIKEKHASQTTLSCKHEDDKTNKEKCSWLKAG